MQIQIGAEMRYVGNAHRFMRGQTVHVVAIHRGYFVDPDSAEIIKAGLVEVTAQDMVEVAPYVEGQPSWIASDASIEDLEVI